jgi:hypothetical protein
MARFPDLGIVYSNSGAAMPTTYTGTALGTPQPTGVASKARYVVTVTAAAGTTLASIQCKLQGFDAYSSGPCDTVSTLDSSGVTELEHTFTVTAGQTTSFSFSTVGGTAQPFGYATERVCVKCTGASVSGDSVQVTCMVA